MNIEHPTLNAQHRIMYSVHFKNTDQEDFARLATKAEGESTLRNSIRLNPAVSSWPNGLSQFAVLLF
jgi:hypothetical protein